MANSDILFPAVIMSGSLALSKQASSAGSARFQTCSPRGVAGDEPAGGSNRAFTPRDKYRRFPNRQCAETKMFARFRRTGVAPVLKLQTSAAWAVLRVPWAAPFCALVPGRWRQARRRSYGALATNRTGFNW